MRSPATLPVFCVLLLSSSRLQGQTHVEVISESNFNVRVISANLTSGNNQRYETPGLHILKALKPDIVAIQEFNYASTNNAGLNTPGAFREMTGSVFGTNFVYYRETNSGYSIPNGVISRWPIGESGEWIDDDTGVNDRGFAWARIELPGSARLYIVSVHLKASGSDAARRAAEAAQLKSLILSNFPASSFLAVAGDLNISSSNETALATLKTFLSDNPIPTDAETGGDPDTNTNRQRRYDYILPGFELALNQVATVIGSHTFPQGLVFDSRVYMPLAEVSPVVSTDSGVAGMQHLAVVKDFRFTATITNLVPVPRPVLTLTSTNILRWEGLPNLTYRVGGASNLNTWLNLGTATSATTNYCFTNTEPSGRWFYRVSWP